MKLDLTLLFQNLAQVSDEPAVSSEGVSVYLLEHILTPAMNGQPVRISGIDFDAFDEDDVEMVADYYNSLSNMGERIRRVAAELVKVFPAASTARAFC